MEKHKHCPFCGFNDAEAEVVFELGCRMARVCCTICGVEVWGIGVMVDRPKPPTDAELIESAWKFWNTRSEVRE